jgi:hypothetical protein
MPLSLIACEDILMEGLKEPTVAYKVKFPACFFYRVWLLGYAQKTSCLEVT